MIRIFDFHTSNMRSIEFIKSLSLFRVSDVLIYSVNLDMFFSLSGPHSRCNQAGIVKQLSDPDGSHTQISAHKNIIWLEAFQCAEQIKQMILNRYNYDLGKEELLYLTIHIARITETS